MEDLICAVEDQWPRVEGDYTEAAGDTRGGAIKTRSVTMPMTQPREPCQEPGPIRFASARPGTQGAARLLPKGGGQSIGRRATLDLRGNCPVCGNPYQPGEGVLALARLPFWAGAAASLPAPPGRDLTDNVILGHQGCVLPRLLTLLAGFQPEARFETAAEDYLGRESRLFGARP